MTAAGSLGVVLAGGRSTRMGRDKALLRYQAKRLVDHMVDVVARAGVDSVVVSGEIEGLACIPDRVGGHGPLGGIHSVVSAGVRMGMAVLFVPVDMPLLSPSLLKKLLASLEHVDSGPHAARFDGCELPAAFLMTSGMRARLAERMGDADPRSRSVRSLLDGLGCVSVPVEPARSHELRNVNFPRQWLEIQDGMEASR